MEDCMACPFIDDGHPKCEERMHVERLFHVMSVCGDNFEQCPIYQEQLARQQDTQRPQLRLRRCA